MSQTSPRLRVGLIGTGFMGKAHALAFALAPRVFQLPAEIELATVADIDEAAAQHAATAYGFDRATTNWRDIIDAPSIDIVSVTTPNKLHKDMSLAAIAAGKHVYCEKPLAPTAADASEMTAAAETAGIKTQVGFNYLCNPLFRLARDMIKAGEIGEVRTYRGLHAEDYMTDARAPYTFRHDTAGGGAFADLGSHTLATAEYLLGPIEQILGDCVTKIGERPDGAGGTKRVEVDDVGRALLRFASGATGTVEGNWVATGRRMQHDFEVYGSTGALVFHGERLNELLLYKNSDGQGQQGFRRILAGPDHPPYGDFCVAPGHQLGFNDLKAIEVAGFVLAIAGLADEPFNFRSGLHIQKMVELTHRSSREGTWQNVEN